MSFKDCVVNANKEGKMSDEQKAYADEVYDQLEMEFAKSSSPENAASRAAKETFDILKAETAHKKRVKLLQIMAHKRIMDFIDRYPGNPGKAMQALIAINDPFAKGVSNLEARSGAINRYYLGYMNEVLAKFGKGVSGRTRNKAEIKDMVREIFGEDSGNVSAKELAQAWKDTHTKMRIRANEAGMRIADNKDWGLPQKHNNELVLLAGEKEWMDFVRPFLNKEKMINEQTGLKFTDETLELALKDVYEKISTNGAATIKPGGLGGQGQKMLANRLQDHRFLVFKDAESWMKYQERFGEPDAFNVMTNHIESMSRTIAELEVLGPNPTQMMKNIKREIERRSAKLVKKEKDKVTSAVKEAEIYYDYFQLRINDPVNIKFAEIMKGVRNVLSAAQLGRASISALTDTQNARITARMIGLPQVSMMTNYFKTVFAGLSSRERAKLAARLGGGADNWIDTAILTARYNGEAAGAGWTARVSDFVMRASGLAPMTQGGRHAFLLEFTGHFGSQVGKKYNELDKLLRESLERYGINASDWDLIRTTKLAEGKYLDYQAIAARTDLPTGKAKELSTKILEAIITETESAIPSTTFRAKATLLGGSRDGTVSGILARSFAQYKQYPVTIMHTMFGRFMNARGTYRKASLFADFIIAVTLMGGVSLQLKEMSKGRQPLKMNTKEFWAKAFLQGGGAGIWGDFIGQSEARYGRGLGTIAGGPTAGLATDVADLTLGSLFRAARGDDTNIGRKAVNFVKQYTPGSSLWYLSLGFERIVLDNIQRMIDPKAEKRWRKHQRQKYRDYEQEYWWSPGESVPSDTPNIGAAFE